jgi:hypothetical protein
MSAANAFASNISAGELFASNATATNLVATTASTGSLDVGGITASTLLVTNLVSAANVFVTNISAGELFSSNITTTNLVVTAASTGSLDATGMTTSSLLVTNLVSAANLFSTYISSGNLNLNTIDISPSLGDIYKERSFSAENNTDGNITGFNFLDILVRSFSADISISILSDSPSPNYFSLYKIYGIQKTIGDWTLSSPELKVGSDISSIFTFGNANSNGNIQLQYTSGNIDGFTGCTIKFRATTTSIN